MIDLLLHPLRRRAYETRVSFNVMMANAHVNQVFRSGREAVSTKNGALIGGVMGLLLIFTVISYAVTPPLKKINISFEETAPSQSAPVPLMAKSSAQSVESAENALMKSLPNLSELPEPAMTLPKPDSQSIYTFLVDKSRRMLFVLEETQENFRILESFPVSLGAERGDKLERGDLRTPEGLYKITGAKESSDIPFEKYGPRAFVLNYPNTLDQKLGKTGYGIWIHGSGLGDKTKPTEGCVQLNDHHILDLEKYAATGVSVYIFPEGYEAPIKNNMIQKNVVDPKILYSIKEWRNRMMAQTGNQIQSGG